MNGVIYARYSSHNQTERSIEGQIADCKAYADLHEIKIIGEYIDRAMTGTNDNRAGFQKMLSDADKGFFDCVIVWKVDRFGRNREEIAINKRRLRKSGVMLLYAKESIPDGPEGVILESVLEGIAEYYSKDLSQKVKRGMKQKAMECKCNGGQRPFGYDVIDGCYTPNEYADVVREIFKRYDNGASFADIAHDLNRQGIRTTKGGEFSGQSVKSILSNKKYCGFYSFDGFEMENGMTRIVDQDIFDSVQEKLYLSSKGRRQAEKRLKFFLTGKMICGECGMPYVADGGTGSKGEYYGYYSCKGHKRKKCDMPSFSKDEMEWYVFRKIYELSGCDDLKAKIIQEVEDDKSKKQADSELKRCKKEYDSVCKKITRLFKAIENGMIPEESEDDITIRLLELNNQKKELEASIKKLENGMKSANIGSIDSFFDKISSLNCQDAMLESFIQKVVINRNRISIVLNLQKEKNMPEIDSFLACCSDTNGMVVHGFIQLNENIYFKTPYLVKVCFLI